MVCSIMYVHVTLMTLMYIDVIQLVHSREYVFFLFWLMCRESLCGESGITITVSLINYCWKTPASRCEGSIEILPLKLL
jgi:hypothetical protein